MDSRILDRIQIAFPDATLEQSRIAFDAVATADYARFASRAEAVQKRYLVLATRAGTPTYGPFASIKAVKRLLGMVQPPKNLSKLALRTWPAL